MAKASAYFTVKDNSSDKELRRIKKEIDTLKGIISVSVNAEKSQIAVDYDTTGSSKEDIKDFLSDIGVTAELESSKTHIM